MGRKRLTLAFMFLSVFTCIWGLGILQATRSTVDRQCYVKSADVIDTSENGDIMWQARWNVSFVNDNYYDDKRHDGRMLISGIRSGSEWMAEKISSTKQIGRTYPCYENNKFPSDSPFALQWTKPTKIKAVLLLVASFIIFLLGIGYCIYVSFYDKEKGESQQTQNIETQYVPIASVETKNDV